MSIAIKTIGNATIYLHDFERTEYDLNKLILILILTAFVIFVAIYFGLSSSNTNSLPNDVILQLSLGFTTVCMIPFSLLIATCTLNWRSITIPVWNISVIDKNSEVYIEGVTFPKTTPERDQVAICQAAKDLEARYLEASNAERKRRSDLEQIAARCK